jgi:hypothetical protein
MKPWNWIVIVALCLALNPPAMAQEAETTLADQTNVAVTIYNNNLALVRDRRSLTLPTGEHALKFMDVAAQIRPETVSLKSMSSPGSLAILEQNYEFDLMNPGKLLEKYVGKTVRLVQNNRDSALVSTDAELMSVNGGPVYRVDDEIFLGYPGQVVLPGIPENLIAKPTLVWLLNNTAADQDIEATYLTGGLGWKADYVLSLNKESTSMDLAGWVTLTNQSGTAYTDATLKLVAGAVNIVPVHRPRGGVEARLGMKMMAESSAPMREESFAEYHLYTLPRATTIKENQTKQVSLLTSDGVSIRKVYEFRGNVSYFSRPMPRLENQKVDVFITFQNEEDNELGMPLPAGIMRLYQEDNDGMLQFAGEDRIDHTPKDEEVRLRMGQAFDVVGERIHTDFNDVGRNAYESSYDIIVRNHKEEDIVVDIVEPMPADWTILNQSHDHVKKDAQTAVFSVPVEADGEVTVQYKVRVQY